jgi:trimeric autotransporter adhesin
VGTTTAAITPLGITGSFTTQDKVYDGTTNATVLTRTLNGVLAADTNNVSLTGGTASFANATVGSGKLVTLVGATLTGSAATNYNLSTMGTTTAAITPLGITGSFTTQDKVYDGTTNATVLARRLNGVLAADTNNVSLTGGTASFANATVGSGKVVTLAGATLTGSAATNYNLTSVATTTAAITALGITGSFTAPNKVYDGTTNATVLTRTLNGVPAADTNNISLTGGTASFANATVGSGKLVTLVGATLAGNAATNYNLSSVGTATASITPATLVVSADAKTKTYGAVDPTFTVSYAGFVNGETNTVLGGTLAFVRAPGENVGSYLITPSGLTSGNYAITFNPGTLTIVAPAPVILSLTGASTANVLLTWSAVSNANYRVQFKSDLKTTNWADLDGDVTAIGSTASKIDIKTTTNRVYRVKVLP